MKNKTFLLLLFITACITLAVCFGGGLLLKLFSKDISSQAISLNQVSQTISASGSIHSQQEIVLHFQTGGKVVYLPFKEGDAVAQGQTIASLDTYALQKQLTTALNVYRSTRDSFDQTKDNSQNAVLAGQQRYAIENLNKSAITTGDVENSMINDMIKRIVDQNQATLDNSVITVELANYAVQLASLTAPFSGVLTQEDITTPNVNVTTQTAFSLADPTQKIFKAQVSASDIDFVSVGGSATITLDGTNKKIKGVVATIYPQKQINSLGQEFYFVDVQADELTRAVFGQNGSVLIVSNTQTKALMIPSWVIVNHNLVWVTDAGKAVLKIVTLGKVHGNMTEIVNGLRPTDKVITQPDVIAKYVYQLL